MRFKLKNNKLIKLTIALILAICLLYIFTPKPDLYNRYSFSSAVYDKHGSLLKLSLSLDDKYRLFVPLQAIPLETQQALLLYEDKSFYRHFGVNPLSLLRAVLSMSQGARKQGASTITMQVARMVYQLDSTTILGKIAQILRALQIELFYSKKQILEAYFNLAPYGGNIEGLGAASLIYFKQNTDKLNLPQTLALTVIPQNPSRRSFLTENGKINNRKAFLRLAEIWKQNYPQHPQNIYLNLPMDSTVFLPNEAPHFCRRLLQQQNGKIYSTLDMAYQQKLTQILRQYVTEQQPKGVNNAAALLVNSSDNSVLAYVGSKDFHNAEILGQVDGVTARRSPGSALKPFIYALALEKGIIHPLSMLKDVPTRYGTYAPENFDHSYYGLLNATKALTLSRNLPAVELLEKVGEQNFYNLLQNSGVYLSKPADYYGLAMALGGIEVSMENLAGLYSMLANNGKFANLKYTASTAAAPRQLLLPEAAFLTKYMLYQNPPPNKKIPYALENGPTIKAAWKTGTSYGFKDAWTAGIFGNFILVVWLGNFDGTPNPAFVGRDLASPLFFRIARQLLPYSKPLDFSASAADLNLSKVKICSETGDLANNFCTKQSETYFIPNITSVKVSNISRLIPIDKKSGLRACRHLPPQTELQSFNFWPSDVKQAFQQAGISFKQPPAFKEDCSEVEDFKQGNAPKIIVPTAGSTLLIHSRSPQKIALQAALDADAQTIYWFSNNRMAAVSKAGETVEITPTYGQIELKAVDDLGRQSSINITVRPLD